MSALPNQGFEKWVGVPLACRLGVSLLVTVLILLSTPALVDAAIATEESAAVATESESSGESSGIDDGDRDWGRDDGIAVGLTTTSKLVIAGGSSVVLALVIWLVAYRKPDGTVHPYEDAPS